MMLQLFVNGPLAYAQTSGNAMGNWRQDTRTGGAGWDRSIMHVSYPGLPIGSAGGTAS